jgi:uncharacterized OsmC-like protein
VGFSHAWHVRRIIRRVVGAELAATIRLPAGGRSSLARRAAGSGGQSGTEAPLRAAVIHGLRPGPGERWPLADPSQIRGAVHGMQGEVDRGAECRSSGRDRQSITALVMDGAVEAGGRDLAPRPMELLLAGTGGCAAYDVVLILKKGRQAVSRLRGDLAARSGQRAEPRVFTSGSIFTFASAASNSSRTPLPGLSRYRSENVLLGVDHAWQDGHPHP